MPDGGRADRSAFAGKPAGRGPGQAFLAAPGQLEHEPLIERVVVGAGLDVADDWIAERSSAGAIVITADIPLANRAVTAGAVAIAPDGRLFSAANIGNILATRNLMDELRSANPVSSGQFGGSKPFSPRDRSTFLSALDLAIVRLKRDGFTA